MFIQFLNLNLEPVFGPNNEVNINAAEKEVWKRKVHFFLHFEQMEEFEVSIVCTKYKGTGSFIVHWH